VNRLLRGLEKIVGSFSWNSPPWLSALGRCRKDHPRVFWGRLLPVLLLIAGGVAGSLYTLSLPGSVLIKASIEAPGLTSNVENAKPQNLIIEFAYDLSDLKPEQERPAGSPSIARIDLVDKVVKSGIILSPALPGQ
jgi:hypothetical protein